MIVPESQVRAVLNAIAGETLQSTETLPSEVGEGMVLLLVPDVHGRRRSALLKVLEGRGAVAGPARPWLEVRASYERALRVRALGLGTDSEEYLAELVLTADASALADLRARALAPLEDLGATSAEKLTETLRSWLLHHGRRDAVAAELFVHAADRALPNGSAPRAVRRPAGGPAQRPGAHHRPRSAERLPATTSSQQAEAQEPGQRTE